MPDTSFSFEKLTNKIQVCVSKEHTFGTDAFLLYDFSNAKPKDLICDLGTGCGIIPLLMSRGDNPPKKIYALDIQPKAIEQLKITLEKSELQNIEPVCADLKELWNGAPLGMFDLVTCNPPYKATDCGIKNELDAHTIARHEILCTIDDVCRAGARLLKFGGRLCICNRPERLCDVIYAMKKHGIEPKRLRFVSKTPSDEPWLFLIEGRKGGKPFLKVMKQFYIKDGENFSEELLKIYADYAE